MPTDESRRIDKHSSTAEEDGNTQSALFQASSSEEAGARKDRGQKRSVEEAQEYDEEVYDDRMFYAMLLKVRYELVLCVYFPL